MLEKGFLIHVMIINLRNKVRVITKFVSHRLFIYETVMALVQRKLYACSLIPLSVLQLC